MSTSEGNLKNRRTHDYGYLMEYQTRWNDNDQYAHLNNSVYNLLFDTIINKYLIERCGLTPSTSNPSSSATNDAIALVIESHATFIRPMSFPSRILLGMKVVKMGKSSVQYEVGIFGPLQEGSAARQGPNKHSNKNTGSKEDTYPLEDDTPAVVGGFTHVFVDRHARRPVAGMSQLLRNGLEALNINDEGKKAKL